MCIRDRFMIALLMNTAESRIVAAVIFALASLTDMLDGQIARKYNLITNFGKLMDPLADKILTAAAMVCLVPVSYTHLDVYKRQNEDKAAEQVKVQKLRGIICSRCGR